MLPRQRAGQTRQVFGSSSFGPLRLACRFSTPGLPVQRRAGLFGREQGGEPPGRFSCSRCFPFFFPAVLHFALTRLPARADNKDSAGRLMAFVCPRAALFRQACEAK